MKKTVKAWAILDSETGTIARYYQHHGEYMIGPRKVPRKELHKTFECVPITITYEPPTKRRSKKTLNST